MIEEDDVRKRAPHWFTRNQPGPLNGGGGGGISDDMDVWQQSVETRLADLRNDAREIRNWLVGGFGFLLVAFASGFLFMLVRMDAGFDKVDDRVDKVAEGQARIEALLTVRPAPPVTP